MIQGLPQDQMKLIESRIRDGVRWECRFDPTEERYWVYAGDQQRAWSWYNQCALRYMATLRTEGCHDPATYYDYFARPNLPYRDHWDA